MHILENLSRIQGIGNQQCPLDAKFFTIALWNVLHVLMTASYCTEQQTWANHNFLLLFWVRRGLN